MPQRSAILYRMKLPTHECPYGLLAKRMLEDARFEIDDRILTSREEVEEFKAEQGVATTPVIFIGDERIDGSDALAEYLETADQD
jgi:glutaredoxin 3